MMVRSNSDFGPVQIGRQRGSHRSPAFHALPNSGQSSCWRHRPRTASFASKPWLADGGITNRSDIVPPTPIPFPYLIRYVESPFCSPDGGQALLRRISRTGFREAGGSFGIEKAPRTRECVPPLLWGCKPKSQNMLCSALCRAPQETESLPYPQKVSSCLPDTPNSSRS